MADAFGRHRLQRHPIPMTCRFEHSLVLAWAVPAPVLEPLVSPGLVLDTYDDPGSGSGPWGFLAVAVVQTRRLRPRGLPAWCGHDYALTGYRIFVHHHGPDGRGRRGLHILRSDTDKRAMRLGGNLLTHYNYRLARIDIGGTGTRLVVHIETPGHEADLHVVAHLGDEPAPLPPGSPFRSAQDARRYAGPLPWTFDYEPETHSIVMIRGRRSRWRPQPCAVDVEICSFLDHHPFAGAGARLANAFHVADIDYSWDRGIRAPLPSPEPEPEPEAVACSA